MIALNARFDGKVLIPDEPLALPANQKVRIELEPIEPTTPADPKRRIEFGLQKDLVIHLAPDWEDPLPDEIWNHNNDNGKAQP